MTTQHIDTKQKPNWTIAAIVCILGACFYPYEFVLQVSPSVMTAPLMRDFGIEAAGLGTLSAFYYYAYTPMQIPAGLLYDKFGPRLLLSLATLICAIGAFFFSLTHSVALASFGRFMMGFGSAFSFIGALFIISRWLPPRHFAFFAGIVQLMSSIGAIAGAAPLAAAVSYVGWQNSIMTIAFIGVGLAGFIWLIVRDQPTWQHPMAHSTHEKINSLAGFKKVIKNKQMWIIGIYSFSVWAPIVVFAALWGAPYLSKLYDISTATASGIISMAWVGIGVGCPLIGWWSNHINRRRLPLILSTLLGLFSTLCILYVPHIPFSMMYVLLFILGLAASGQSLSFALVKDLSHPNVVGTAIGFNNMAIVASGALFQPLVGFILNYLWNGEMIDNTPVYSAHAYQCAMFILPLCYFIALILSLKWMRETHCQSDYLFPQMLH